MSSISGSSGSVPRSDSFKSVASVEGPPPKRRPWSKISEDSAIKKIDAALQKEGLTIDDITYVKAIFRHANDGNIVMKTYTPEPPKGEKKATVEHLMFEMTWEVTVGSRTFPIHDIIYSNIEIPQGGVTLSMIEQAKTLGLQAASTYQEVIGAALNPQDPLHNTYKKHINTLRADGSISLEGDPHVWASNKKINEGHIQPYELTPWATIKIGSADESLSERINYLSRLTERATSEIFRKEEGAPDNSTIHNLRDRALTAHIDIRKSPLDPSIAAFDMIDHIDSKKPISNQINRLGNQSFCNGLVQKIQHDLSRLQTLLVDASEKNILDVDDKAVGMGVMRRIKKATLKLVFPSQTLYRRIAKVNVPDQYIDAHKALTTKMMTIIQPQLPPGAICTDPTDLPTLKRLINDDAKFEQLKRQLTPLIKKRDQIEPRYYEYTDLDKQVHDLADAIDNKLLILDTFLTEKGNPPALLPFKHHYTQLSTTLSTYKKAARL